MSNSSDPFEEMARFALVVIDEVSNRIAEVGGQEAYGPNEEARKLDYAHGRAENVITWAEKVASNLEEPSLLEHLRNRLEALRKDADAARLRLKQRQFGRSDQITSRRLRTFDLRASKPWIEGSLYYCEHDEPTMIEGRCPKKPCPGESRR